jgi:hypothetical protein
VTAYLVVRWTTLQGIPHRISAVSSIFKADGEEARKMKQVVATKKHIIQIRYPYLCGEAMEETQGLLPNCAPFERLVATR